MRGMRYSTKKTANTPVKDFPSCEDASSAHNDPEMHALTSLSRAFGDRVKARILELVDPDWDDVSNNRNDDIEKLCMRIRSELGERPDPIEIAALCAFMWNLDADA